MHRYKSHVSRVSRDALADGSKGERTGGPGVIDEVSGVSGVSGRIAPIMRGRRIARTIIWRSAPTHVPIHPLIHFGSPTCFAFM